VLADGHEAAVRRRESVEVEKCPRLALCPGKPVGARDNGAELADSEPLGSRPEQAVNRRSETRPTRGPARAVGALVDRLRVREAGAERDPAAAAPRHGKQEIARRGVRANPGSSVTAGRRGAFLADREKLLPVPGQVVPGRALERAGQLPVDAIRAREERARVSGGDPARSAPGDARQVLRGAAEARGPCLARVRARQDRSRLAGAQKLRAVPGDVREVARDVRGPRFPSRPVRRDQDRSRAPHGDDLAAARGDTLQRVALRDGIYPAPGSAGLPANESGREEESEHGGESNGPRHGNLA
jgi:hypothetical protein